jgi:hypothetical protein
MIKLTKEELKVLKTLFREVKKQLSIITTDKRKNEHLKRFGISYLQLNNIIVAIKTNHTETIRNNIKTFLEKSNESIKNNSQDKEAVFNTYNISYKDIDAICVKLDITIYPVEVRKEKKSNRNDSWSDVV